MNLVEQLELPNTEHTKKKLDKPIRFTISNKTAMWMLIDHIADQTGQTRNDVIRKMLIWAIKEYFSTTNRLENSNTESEANND